MVMEEICALNMVLKRKIYEKPAMREKELLNL